MKDDNYAKPPFVVNRGRVVHAVYRAPEIDAYEGNPLEEALPPMLTTDQLILRLQHFPAYDESQRKVSNEVRYLLIQNGMRFFVPLDIHIDLYRRFTNLIHVGYTGRNPMAHRLRATAKSKSGTFDQYSNQHDPAGDQLASTAAGFNIAGISGIGKSFSIDRILKLFPQIIHHSNYRGHDFTQSQIVWLKIDCPFDGNPRGLCNSFFKITDAILGTNFCKRYMKTRRLQSELLSDMGTVAENHLLGVLVIDEIQRLSLAKSGGADVLLNFLVQLVNEIGVPVVLVGTYKALAVLSGEFSHMRRGTGQGDLIWDRMAKDEQWEMLVRSLFRTQYTRKSFSPDDIETLSKRDLALHPTYVSQKLSDVLYEETQGITDLAVKVYMFAQERAIDTGKELVTAKIIRSVAKDKFGMLRDVLLALKYGNKQALSRWDDVYPTAIKDYLASLPEEAQEELKVEGKVSSSPEIKSILNTTQRTTALKQTDSLTSSDAENPVGMNSSLDPSVNCVVNGKTSGNRKVDRNGRGKSKAKGVLPEIVTVLDNKDGTAAHEALHQAGHTRSSTEFIP